MPKYDLKKHAEEIEFLVKDAQNGDTDAFAKLYDFYIDPVYRYIFFKVAHDEALDLTETVFLKVWEHLKSYKDRTGSFSSWIFRIAHNVVVDHYRLKKDLLPLDANVPAEKQQSDPEAFTEQQLDQETLRKAITKLGKKYQEVILLRYINGLEHDEIARIMKRSEGSLRILKFRALQALKKILQEMGIYY